MTIFGTLMRRSRALVVIAAVLGVLSGLCGASLAKIIGDAMHSTPAPPAMALVFFSLCVLFLFLKTGSEILLMRISQTAVLQLRIGLSRKLLQTPFTKLQQLGKHELLAILTADIGTFVSAFQMMPQVFGNAVVILACFAYLAWLSLPLFSLFGVFFIAGVFSYHFAERTPLRQIKALRNQIDMLYKGFRDLVEGAKELQLNRKRGEYFVREHVERAAHDSRDIYLSAMLAYTCVSNFGTLLFYAVIGLLLFVAPNWLLLDKSTLITFTIILMFLIRPISEMVTALPVVRHAGVAWKKIQQLDVALSRDSKSDMTADPFVSSQVMRLELKSVTHSHSRASDEPGFKVGPIDLDLTAGEVLFLVGGNGGGKTTLSMLILGLYQPNSGAIFLNGVQVNEQNVDHYRQHFSAVFSDFQLFEHLFESDAVGAHERGSKLLDIFGLADKVSIVGGSFSRLDLSTGQRKRLALISAYLEDRPIHIYDEWAADQDPTFRRLFYTELLPQLKSEGKAVIVITHDDAYFEFADRVIRLEGGRPHPATKRTNQSESLDVVPGN